MSDHLDQELAVLRDRLRADAARDNDDAAALADVHAGPLMSPSGDRRPNRGRVTAAIATAALVAASGVVVVLARHDDHVTTTPVTPTTAHPTSDPSLTTVVTPNRSADSVTDVFFVDPDHGWMTTGVAGAASTYRTSDGGGTWTQLANAPTSASQVTFADREDGWITTQGDGVWSTHDGGATFHKLSAPLYAAVDGSVTSLLVNNGSVFAAGIDGAGFRIFRAHIGSDDFTATDVALPTGAGPVASFSMAGQGNSEWFVYNDRVVTGSAHLAGDTADLSWKPPASDQGGPMNITMSADGGPMYAYGQTGVWTGVVPQNVAFVSDDGDPASFHPITVPGSASNPIDLLAADPGTVLAIGGDGDATVIARSRDKGTTWTTVSRSAGLLQVRFVSGQTMIALAAPPDQSAPVALRSDDGGVTWKQIVTPSSPPSTSVSLDRFDQIGATTFVDANHGWAPAHLSNPARAVLLHTDDGATWSERALAADAYGVVFANRLDGWMWGDGWWSSHDGGATWKRLPDQPNGFSPNHIQVSGQFVYALQYIENVHDTGTNDTGTNGTNDTNGSGGFGFALIRSPIDHDEFTETGLSWRKGAGGNDIDFTIVTAGDRVEVSYNDRGGQVGRLLGGVADTTWRPPGLGRGGNISLDRAKDGGPIFLSTHTGDWGGDTTPVQLEEVSTDEGRTFHTLTMPSPVGASDAARFCGLNAAGSAWVVVSICDADGTNLYGSADVGSSWTRISVLPANSFGLTFHTPAVATVQVKLDNASAIWISQDSGRTWHRTIP